jgi:hypothetical protein
VRAAFKEWAVVVDALGCGGQILTFRKGGIGEGLKGFIPEHMAFLLFPTYFHEQREGVVEAARLRFDEIQRTPPPPETMRIEFHAEVKAHRRLESFSQAETLRGQHILRDEIVASRFEWGPFKGIYVLALRVHRLRMPVELPMRSDYGGCKSWVELDREISTEGSTPVLTDKEFHTKLAEFQQALGQTPAIIT